MVPVQLSFPYILGRDLAGVVVEAGAAVKHFKAGDRVWASNQGSAGRAGTFAEFAAVDECWLHPIPEGVGDEAIVAMSLVGITAHGSVREARRWRANIVRQRWRAALAHRLHGKILGRPRRHDCRPDEKVVACKQLERTSRLSRRCLAR
jgi:NADPH:quinone reductase-like Zn-dependent oxidoreductase